MSSIENSNHIAILIPCYNEAQTIGNVVKSYHRAIPDATIYVCDNNSTDGTGRIAKAAGAKILYEGRQGKGNALRTLFRSADADCYLVTDGDDTYPAEDAARLCQPVLDGKVDMMIGDRLSSTYFEENKRPFHNAGNCVIRFFINLLWRKHGREKIQDVMTGLRALSPTFVDSLPLLSEGFEIETEMTVHALDKNFRIGSMPIAYRDRPKGSYSKLHTFSDGRSVLWTVFRLFRYYRPLLFFGTLSLLLASLAIVFFIPVFQEYLATGLVPRMPTLVMSAITMLAALLSFACGLILDAVAENSRKTFELQLNLLKVLQNTKKNALEHYP